MLKNIKSFREFRQWIYENFKDQLSETMNFMLLEFDYEGSELSWVYSAWTIFQDDKEMYIDEEDYFKDMIKDEITCLSSFYLK